MEYKIEIDNEKLEKMKIRILKLEKQNLKTKEKNEATMISEIKTIIVEESKRNY